MKKGCLFTAAFFLCMSLFAVPAFASTGQYTLNDLQMTVEIPDNFAVLTRETPEDDPFLEALGMTKEVLVSEFTKSNIYLDAVAYEAEDVFEIVITMEENEDAAKIFNLKQYKEYYSQNAANRYGTPEEYMGNVADDMMEGLKDEETGIAWTYEGMLDGEQAFYYIIHSQAENQGGKTEGVHYLTIVNGRSIIVAFITHGVSITEGQRQLLGDTVKSIRFTEMKEAPQANFKEFLDAEEPLLWRILRPTLIGAAAGGVAALALVYVKKRNRKKMEEMKKSGGM
ncbi:MAG: hypothetical protein ACYCX2_02435 [Christensenellales bacterium]